MTMRSTPFAVSLRQYSLDRRPDALEFFLDALVAAIDVVDPVDERFALRRQASQDQPGRGTQVGRHDGRRRQPIDPCDNRGVALKLNIGTHALQLENMLKAVLEHRFRNRGKLQRHYRFTFPG